MAIAAPAQPKRLDRCATCDTTYKKASAAAVRVGLEWCMATTPDGRLLCWRCLHAEFFAPPVASPPGEA